MVQKFMVEKSGVEKFMAEKSGVERFGVERFGVGKSFNRKNYTQLCSRARKKIINYFLFYSKFSFFEKESCN